MTDPVNPYPTREPARPVEQLLGTALSARVSLVDDDDLRPPMLPSQQVTRAASRSRRVRRPLAWTGGVLIAAAAVAAVAVFLGQPGTVRTVPATPPPPGPSATATPAPPVQRLGAEATYDPAGDARPTEPARAGWKWVDIHSTWLEVPADWSVSELGSKMDFTSVYGCVSQPGDRCTLAITRFLTPAATPVTWSRISGGDIPDDVSTTCDDTMRIEDSQEFAVSSGSVVHYRHVLCPDPAARVGSRPKPATNNFKVWAVTEQGVVIHWWSGSNGGTDKAPAAADDIIRSMRLHGHTAPPVGTPKTLHGVTVAVPEGWRYEDTKPVPPGAASNTWVYDTRNESAGLQVLTVAPGSPASRDLVSWGRQAALREKWCSDAICPVGPWVQAATVEIGGHRGTYHRLVDDLGREGVGSALRDATAPALFVFPDQNVVIVAGFASWAYNMPFDIATIVQTARF